MNDLKELFLDLTHIFINESLTEGTPSEARVLADGLQYHFGHCDIHAVAIEKAGFKRTVTVSVAESEILSVETITRFAHKWLTSSYEDEKSTTMTMLRQTNQLFYQTGFPWLLVPLADTILVVKV